MTSKSLLDRDLSFGHVHPFNNLLPLTEECYDEGEKTYGDSIGNVGSGLIHDSVAPGGTWRQFDGGGDARRFANFAVYDGPGDFAGAYIETKSYIELGDVYVFNGVCSIFKDPGKYVDMIFDYNPDTDEGRTLRFHSNGDLEIVDVETIEGLFTPSTSLQSKDAAHPKVCIVYRRSTRQMSLTASQTFGDGREIFPSTKIGDYQFNTVINGGPSFAFRISKTTSSEDETHHIDRLAYRPLSGLETPIGEAYAWYDPSDLTTLFQDSNATVPVASDGDPVGRIIDKSGFYNDGVASGSARPIYRTDGTHHWLEFDGVNDILNCGSAISLDTITELLVSFAANVRTPDQEQAGGFISRTIQSSFPGFSFNKRIGDPVKFFGFGNDGSGPQTVRDDASYLDQKRTYTGVWVDQDELTFRGGGAQIETITPSTNDVDTGGAANLTIGELSYGNGAFNKKFDFYGAFIAKTDVKSKVGLAESWLADKMGITL